MASGCGNVANKALPSAEATMLPSFVTRLREVAGIVQGRASRRPLLATPTDTGAGSMPMFCWPVTRRARRAARRSRWI